MIESANLVGLSPLVDNLIIDSLYQIVDQISNERLRNKLFCALILYVLK